MPIKRHIVQGEGRSVIDRSVVVLILSLLIFLFHAYLYYPFTVDDAFISFRYAQNFADGKGLVFNPGERVEGYTNFLFVLFEAAAIKTGLNPEYFVKSLNILCGMIIILLAFEFNRLCLLNRRKNELAPLMLACTGSFALAAVNGLETMTFALFLFLSVIAACRGMAEQGRFPYSAAFFLGIAALLRPEGFLCYLIFLSFLCLKPSRLKKDLGYYVLWTGLFLLITAPLIGWRLVYYGLPVPNTYYARMPAGPGLEILIAGLKYTIKFFLRTGVLLPVFLLFSLYGVMKKKFPESFSVVFWLPGCFLFYIIYSGGDWVPFDRFFVPLLPLLFIAAAGGLFLREGKRFGKTTAFLLILFFGLNVFSSGYNLSYILMRAKGYRHAHASIGDWLRLHGSAEETAALMDVGIIGYLSGMRIYDLSGLTQQKIAFDRYEKKPFDLDHLFQTKPEYLILISGSREGLPDQESDWPVNGLILRDSRLKQHYQRLFSRNHYRYADPRAFYRKLRHRVESLSPVSLFHERASDYYLLVYKRRGASP